MRHRLAGKQLNRNTPQRTALRRGLVTELFRHGAIQTTEAKAAAVRNQAEKMITKAKRSLATGDPVKVVNARRQAATVIYGNEVVKKLFDEIAPKFATRNGGYTRILKTGHRRGDGAEMARIELVPTE